MDGPESDYFVADAPSTIPCCLCAGSVVEFSVPSDIWNIVVRGGREETDREYLCLSCFHRQVAEFVRAMAY